MAARLAAQDLDDVCVMNESDVFGGSHLIPELGAELQSSLAEELPAEDLAIQRGGEFRISGVWIIEIETIDLHERRCSAVVRIQVRLLEWPATAMNPTVFLKIEFE